MTLGVKPGLLIESWHQFCAVTLSASAARGPLRASRLPRPTVRACKHRSPGRWIGRSTPGQNKRLRPCVAFPKPASDGERTAASGDRRDARGTYRWQPSINGKRRGATQRHQRHEPPDRQGRGLPALAPAVLAAADALVVDLIDGRAQGRALRRPPWPHEHHAEASRPDEEAVCCA